MRREPMRRLPVEPLLVAAGGHDDRTVAELLGVHRRAVSRAREHGLTDRMADRWACRLGVHPGTVWSEWWDIITDDEESSSAV